MVGAVDDVEAVVVEDVFLYVSVGAVDVIDAIVVEDIFVGVGSKRYTLIRSNVTNRNNQKALYFYSLNHYKGLPFTHFPPIGSSPHFGQELLPQ